MAGSEFSKGGVEFVANMPTEEVFTAPLRDGVNGKIVATKPLVDSGNIIDGFHMILKDGVITEVHAEVGEEFLKKAITLDEGASRSARSPLCRTIHRSPTAACCFTTLCLMKTPPATLLSAIPMPASRTETK